MMWASGQEQCMAPIYEVIAGKLRGAIDEGVHAHLPGDQLPTMAEVAAEYGTTTTTVQKAFDILRTEGRIARRGTRYVVRGPVRPLMQHVVPLGPDQRTLDTWASDMLALGRDPETKSEGGLEIPKHQDVPARVAEALNIDGPGQVVVRRSTHLADGVPRELEDAYVPMSIAQGTPLMFPDDSHPAVVAELDRLGIHVSGPSDFLDARPATESEATALGLERRAWVQEITRICYGPDGVPVLAIVIVYGAGSIVRVYDGPVSPPVSPGA
jgi:GntR family transcriptional regulator